MFCPVDFSNIKDTQTKQQKRDAENLETKKTQWLLMKSYIDLKQKFGKD
jgi:hypothetical protein